MRRMQRWIGLRVVARAALLGLALAAAPSLEAGAAPPAAPDPAATGAAPAAAAPAPALPFALNEVAVQAADVLARTELLLSRVAEQKNDPEVAAAISELGREVQRGRAQLDEALERDYSRNEVEELRARWKALEHDLSEPLDTLDRQIASLEQFLAELRAADERWRATLVEFEGSGAPPTVRQTADSTVASLAEARSTGEKRRNYLLARQAHVVSLRSSVTEVLRSLDAAEARMLSLSFQRNRAPIWRSISELGELRLDTATRRLALGKEALARGVRHYAGALCAQGVALLALLWLGWRARRAALRRTPDAPAEELPLALRHVVASAVLLAIAPVPWVYTSAPPELTRPFAMAVLPAWLVLLRSFLPASLHPTVLGLGLVLLLDALRELVGTAFAARQLLLVLELGLAAFGALWLRRPARLAAAAPLLGAGGWVFVLDAWLRIGALLLPLGAIAAAAGFVMFAEAVLRFYVGGSYAGSVLMLGAALAEQLSRAWLEGGALDFLQMVRHNRERVLAVLRRGYRVAATLTWLALVVRGQGVSAAVLGTVRDALAWRIGYGDAQLSLGGVVAFVVTLWVGWLAGRFVFFVLDEEVFPRVGLPRGIPYALATISQYVITTVAFLLGLSALGLDLGKISILMGALGVGIGFGLQNAVSNFISGLMLLFERPIQLGDRLQLEEVTGVVTRIGIRASRVRTIEGADVIVPNSELISSRVTNWTLADRVRMVAIPIGVAYGSDLRRALAVLVEVASAEPNAHRHPAPEAIFIGFGESSVDFQVRVFTDADNFVAVRTSLGLAISEGLAAAGIAIPFPQRDLHLRSVEESVRAPHVADPAGRKPESEHRA